MGKRFEKEYEFFYHDLNYRKELLLTSLVNYFGDVAMTQSNEEGVGIEFLDANNMAWVLYKWDIKMIRYPIYGEKLKISTTPVALKKFYSYRIFDVVNEAGEVLCKAISMWLLINTEKRRAIRVPQIMFDAYGTNKDEGLNIEIDEVEELKKIDFEQDFKVRYSDIDTNMHVNNTKYIDWAIETIPLDVVKTKRLMRLKMVYKKEVHYGHVIKSLCEKREEGHYVHKIVSDDGVEVNLAESFWE